MSNAILKSFYEGRDSDGDSVDLFDIQQVGNELDVSLEAYQGAADAFVGLSKIKEQMISHSSEGMVDPDSIRYLKHAANACLFNTGLESEHIVASLESLLDEECNTLSLEAIDGTLKKIWNGMKAANEKVTKSIGDLFSKIFNGIDGLKDDLQELKREVKELKGKSVKSGTTIKVSEPNALKYKGEINGKDLIAGTKNLVEVSDAVLTKFLSNTPDIYKTIHSSIKRIIFAPKDSEVQEADSKISAMKKEAYDKIKKANGVVITGDRLLDTDKFTQAKVAKSFSGDGKITPLTIDELNSLISNLEKICDNVSNSKKAFNKIDGMLRGELITAVLGVLFGPVGIVLTSKSHQRLALMGEQTFYTTLARDVYNTSYGVVRSAIKVIERSIAEYE